MHAHVLRNAILDGHEGSYLAFHIQGEGQGHVCFWLGLERAFKYFASWVDYIFRMCGVLNYMLVECYKFDVFTYMM